MTGLTALPNQRCGEVAVAGPSAYRPPCLRPMDASVTHRPPCRELSGFVTQLWSFEGRFTHSMERVLPTGLMQLLINLDEDELRSYGGTGFREVRRVRGIAVQGPATQAYGIDTAEQRCIVGVCLRPAAVSLLPGVSAAELLEACVDLDDLWGRTEARALRETLLECASPHSRLAVVERALLRRARAFEPDRIVQRVAEALNGSASVTEVLDGVGVSRRRFVERFRHAVGMTPKRFARVRRFHRVLECTHGDIERIDWAAVAADCGYFDQAHLINEFRGFAGLTPARYRPRVLTTTRGMSIDVTHVPLND